MSGAVDLERLNDALRARGAHPALQAWVAELDGPDLGAPEDLAWEDCQLLLECALDLACEEGPVDGAWLDAFEDLAARLGLPEDHADGVVCEVHGVTLRHLRSLAELGLPVGSTTSEIKLAHRDLARRWHPDRIAIEAERRAAEERLAKINAARRVLDRAEEVVLARPDDLWLDEPDWDPEDAPTEGYEDGLTELLEPA